MLDEKDLLAIAQLMDQKLQPIGNRLDRIEVRLDRIESRQDQMEARLDRMEARQNQMEKQLTARFDYLTEAVAKVDRRLAYNTKLLNQTDKEIMRDMDVLRS